MYPASTSTDRAAAGVRAGSDADRGRSGRRCRATATAWAAAATAVVVGLSGCASQLSGTAATSSPPHSGGRLTVVTEPQQGFGALYALIAGAKSSIDLTMYELRDKVAEQDLAAAAARGVRVRVVLDTNLEHASNQPAYTYLSAHRVHVVWAATSYAATHQKTLTVDDRESVIMTANLVTEDYSSTRDVLVTDSGSADVAAIERVFQADYSHSAVTPGDGDDLVWSPTDSQPELLALIKGARHSLSVENEEMGSSTIVSALEKAARRGVKVDITMTDSGSYTREFAALTKAGAKVHTYAANASLYIHAKIVLADYGTTSARVFVGSQNFSTASLRRNRELGLVTNLSAVLNALQPVLTSDFAHADPHS
jgi:cardiolipin synthase A/B